MSICTDGDSHKYEENRFLCKDIGAIFENGLKVVNQWDLPGTFFRRLSYIDDEIWAPGLNNYVDIFSLNEKKRGIETPDKMISVVKKIFNGDMIVGGKNGLWVMNKTGTEWEKIADGRYSDVFVSHTELFALRCDQPSLQTFQLVEISGDTNTKTWQMVSKFSLDGILKNNDLKGLATGCVFGAKFQYFAISSVANRTITVLNKDGRVVKAYKSGSDLLFIAGVQESCDIVTVNYTQSRIEVIDRESEEMRVLRKYDLPGIKLPMDLVMDRAGDIWCLHGNGNKLGLRKLTRVD